MKRRIKSQTMQNLLKPQMLINTKKATLQLNVHLKQCLN
jgi:hypothetical protein